MPRLSTNRRTKKLLVTGIFCALVGYFIYHLFEGRYGLKAWRKLKTQHKELVLKTDTLQKETDVLDDKVARLQPDNLDMDYVEELIHEKAGIFHKDDLIVYPDKKKP